MEPNKTIFGTDRISLPWYDIVDHQFLIHAVKGMYIGEDAGDFLESIGLGKFWGQEPNWEWNHTRLL